MRSSVVALFVGMAVQVSCLSALGQSSDADALGGFVVGESHCPTASEVIRETLRLTPPHNQDTYASNVRVKIEDLDDRYHLQIYAPSLRVERTYVDLARDCSRRARFAAVLIVLTLMPPQVASDSETTSAEAPATVPPASGESPGQAGPNTANPAQPALLTEPLPPSEPPMPVNRSDAKMVLRRTWFRADMGVALRWSPPIFHGPELLSPGVMLRGSMGPSAWNGYASAGYFRTTEFELQGITARMQRFPLALGIAVTSARGAFSYTGQLGVVLALSRVKGSGLLTPRTHSTWEWGTELGWHIAFGRGTLVPIGGVTLELFPFPDSLTMAPRGRLGRTPALELVTYLGGRIGF